ncbi:NAD(P)-binding domain-containing protein [Macrococcoides caseolyticum]|uniref:NAD(P)-binding domain-containing protein n=1 Tax=Macrococcoides caseolyticum TaxID=69966 RepID=UPI001F388E54|nr:NAD(P)-binding domain-containing protein [Macrococcus caseolyticus]MCE4957177.1 NAD(P)/FAD-dependent oxidoreductase [Macrococcus caseolyticus]
MRTIIIGGGIQGITIALKLLEVQKVRIDDLLIIDPNPFISRWEKITKKIGMDYLRSPLVHHVHPNPMHLKQYAKDEDYAQGFSGYYQKPRLEMFNNHIHDQIKSYGLDACYVQDKAINLKRSGEQFTIQCENNTFICDRVILAIGMNHLHYVPEFLQNVPNTRYSHVFNNANEIDDDTDVIIGGGITAFHIARKLSIHKKITLVMRHDIRCHELDADPGWLGPKNMKYFDNVTNYEKRREIIKNARHRGSVPMHLKQSISNLVRQGKINLVIQGIHHADKHCITLENNEKIPFRKIILATGCQPNLNNDIFIQNIIHNFDAPVAQCGFPIVSKHLEWIPGVFVAGPLAELELGPISRNIIGGRKASERIAEFI